MNVEQLISLANTAIDQRQGDGVHPFHLCDSEGFLGCLPRNHTGIPHRIFYSLHEMDIESGLTLKAWHSIGKSMKDFYKEGTPCLQPLKH